MVAPSENSASGEPPKRKGQAKPSSVVGRPTGYDPAICPGAAFRLCQMGSTSAEIAEAFGCSLSTLYEWQKAFPELADSIKRGKAAADDLVEQSLYQRARGYSHPDVQINVLRDGTVIKTDYTKVYPPDTTSMIFWLKNRRPREWRDRIEMSLDVDAGAKLTADEQAKLWAANYRASAAISERLVASIEMKNVTGTAGANGGTIAPA